MLVPLNDSSGSMIGVMALGDKRSGLPFSQEDEIFLASIASAGALALENSLFRTSRLVDSRDSSGSLKSSGDSRAFETPGMECMRCHRVWDPDARECPRCKSDLTAARVPYELGQKFRFEARIGQGGMGVVYRGLDLVLGRTIAVKTLPRLSNGMAARLRQEAKAMASVTHPNLAAIHGAENWGGAPLLIFEYLAGGTLSDRLRVEPLEIADALNLGIVLSDALSAVHRSNILHRDIKPSNIGFTSERVPKLLDFGLARVLFSPQTDAAGIDHNPFDEADEFTSMDDTLTKTKFSAAGHLVGTPLYLSPEALKGLSPDRSFDLWGLALTIFEAVAGKNPFRAPTLRGTFDKITSGHVDDLEHLRPEAPQELSELFRTALSPDRRLRPSSAEEFGEDLSRVQEILSARVQHSQSQLS